MRKLLIVLIIISWGGSCFAGTTGFQEYIIPGPEEILRSHYVYIDNNPSIGNTLHSVVSITASTDGTVINYDHWENGYGSADETITLNANEFYYFESSNVPANPRGTAIYYDGGDRLSIIGGPVFVARASWPESPGTVLALAWELYPLQALEETFEMPVGSELFPSPDPGSDNGPPFSDFEAVILMVQSCADNNTITITNASGTQVWSGIVNKGRNVTDPTAAAYLRQVEKGATVSGTAPIQTQFITGDRDIFSIR
ncbi:hypothetical protein JW935_17415, partial [candidate division KSB1 bacterium]|nr:hypothetical protein [candidate division KSB1 bacterium]